MTNFLEKNYKPLVILILTFILIVSTLNAYWDTAIFDETAHIPAGYSYLTKHEMRLNPEHPPLIKDISAVPLLFLNLNFDTNQPFWTGELPRKWDEGQWVAGRYLLFGAGNNPDHIIFWSRLPIVILSLILGFFIFRWVREMAGIIAGLFALVLYAFDPNILGHNHFVTTDLGIAAFFTFAFYYFLRFIKDPQWKNVLLSGIFVGLLFLTKFSFIIALPIFGLIGVVYPLVKANRSLTGQLKEKIKFLGEYAGKGALIFAISLVVVWAVYAVNTYRTSQETMSDIIDFNFSPTDTEVKNIYTNETLHTLNDNVITRPLVEWGIGLGYVFRRVSGGNGAYFMGEVSGKAFTAYFPTVFALKETLPSLTFMLFALIIGSIAAIRSFVFNVKNNPKSKLQGISLYIREHIRELALFGFVVLYSYVSITGNLNIGFRHLFPILPFVYILTTLVIFRFIKCQEHFHTQNVWYSAVLFIAILLIAETASSYPYYMSYFNQLVGGPKLGYRYVTDSNADWGQDLRRLKVWIENYNRCAQIKCDPNMKFGCPGECYDIARPFPTPLVPIDKIRVNYFGGADIKYYLGDRSIDWWDSKRPIEPGWYALSTNYLQGSLYDKEKKDEDSYRWIKNIKPAAQVGTSILVYYVTEDDIQRYYN